MQHIQNKEEIFKILGIISSGYAGTLLNGNIVDRREFPEAAPIQKNSMFNVPVPKPVNKQLSVKPEKA